MKMTAFLRDFATIAAVTFVVAAAVTYAYGWLVHGVAVVNWETAFDLALVLGIVLPFAMSGRPR